MPRIPEIRKVLMIGSGPIVIGQAAEFDYAGTQACKALREEGVTSVLVNSNPATIMTDEGVADVTYIEPLTVEVLARIIERERPDGILGTLGGQTGLNLAVKLHESGVLERFGTRLLGTPVQAIQTAEDREAFKQLLIQIGEPVPPSRSVETLAGAEAFAEEIGLPLVIRPAFTLGGTGGGVAWTRTALHEITGRGLAASPIHQVLIEQYLRGWKEIEYEVLRDAGDTCITVCNMENLDPLGIHTGDSIVVAPSQTLTDREYQMLRSASHPHHSRAGGRGRLQRAIRAGSQFRAVLRDRGESPRQPLVGARQQGDGVSHRPRRDESGAGVSPARDHQRRHGTHQRRFRAGSGLCRCQDSPLAV